MVSFYADLHIHSRFSRATSRDCNLVELSYWARRKGITVVGTGDFTHPEWRQELEDTLIPAEPGLFRLPAEIERNIEQRLAGFGPSPQSVASVPPTRFILQVEISTIYKKGDRTRKVHHVIYAPDLDTAGKISARLDQVGNIKSDGRPILGLDSRSLLEIVLECGEDAFLIPAHVWTPWFSVLGSKSGFETIEECYADLSPHIFAVETGLSSDPPMNWRLSALDKYRLVSNSDAHSPPKLGRESCVFECDVDSFAMRRALETGEQYGGTVEFFPEEGKYHLDGHRKCGTRLTPEETKALDGRCPVCGKPVTVGVMHRVDDLADRPEGTRPEGAAPFRSFVPLPEVLSELLGVGPQSKRVRGAYDDMLARLGPEFHILDQLSTEDLRRGCSELLAEAIMRMRGGHVIRRAGYDGEYGVIRLFEEGELRGRDQSTLLFDVGDEQKPAAEERRARDGAPSPRGKDGLLTQAAPGDVSQASRGRGRETGPVQRDRWRERA